MIVPAGVDVDIILLVDEPEDSLFRNEVVMTLRLYSL